MRCSRHFSHNMEDITSGKGIVNSSSAPESRTPPVFQGSCCSIFSFLCSVLDHCLSYLQFYCLCSRRFDMTVKGCIVLLMLFYISVHLYIQGDLFCRMLFLLRVSDCLMPNAVIFQLYHGENKLIFNEMMMSSAFYQTNMLSWILIVPAH